MTMEIDEPQTMEVDGEEDQQNDHLAHVFSHRNIDDHLAHVLSHRNIDVHLRAVVETLRDDITQRNLPLSPVSYLGSAIAALERISPDRSPSQSPTMGALLGFLAILVPAVSPSVIRSAAIRIGCAAKGFFEGENVSNGVAKAAVRCVGGLLMCGDKGNWTHVQPLYTILLGFVTDKRDEVRMQAHSCLHDVLQSFEGTPVLSSASEQIATVFDEFLSLARGSNLADINGVQLHRGVWEVLFVLNALKNSLPIMSNKCRTKILMFFKPLLVLKQPIVTKVIVEILHVLCRNSSVEVPSACMLDILCFFASSNISEENPADVIASVARLLHVAIKKINGSNTSTSALKLPLIFSALGDIFACSQEEPVFASVEAFKGLISTCIHQSVIDEGIEQIILTQNEVTKRSDLSTIEKICETMEALLGYKYFNVWNMSFQIISVMFDRLGKSSSHLMAGVIKILANLEKLPDENFGYRKQLHECVGSAICALGPEMFLKILPLNLESEYTSDANIWLLPILKKYTVGSELRFFKESILIMISQLQQRSKKLEREGLIVSSRNARGIVHALWSLLPTFCNYPSDTATSFCNFLKELSYTLHKEPDLHGLICSSLQILIQQNKKIMEDYSQAPAGRSWPDLKEENYYTPELAKKNLESIRSSFKLNIKNHCSRKQTQSGNIISVLTDIFLRSVIDSDGYVQSIFCEVASISDKSDVINLFKLLVEPLEEKKNETKADGSTTETEGVAGGSGGSTTEISEAASEAGKAASETRRVTSQAGEPTNKAGGYCNKARHLELAVSLLPGLSMENIEQLLEVIVSGIQDKKDFAYQKTSYKALFVILKGHSDFSFDGLFKLMKKLKKALRACFSCSRHHRLASLYYLTVRILECSLEYQKEKIVMSVLTEFTFSLKESNSKIRNKASNFLIGIVHAYVDKDELQKAGKLQNLFHMVAQDLTTQSAPKSSANIRALACLTYEFSDLLVSAYKLLQTLFLCERKEREICKANLGLLKVVFAKSSDRILNMHLTEIVEGLIKLQDDTKFYFKAKVKMLLAMLIHKCGLDAVKMVMPEEHMKLLNNLRKIANRKEREAKSEDGRSIHFKAVSRRSRRNGMSLFSEADDGHTNAGFMDSRSTYSSWCKVPSLRSKKLQRSKSLPGDLLDQLESDPLDLLDHQRTRDVLKSSRRDKRNLDVDDELEINWDGRLVILESGEKVHKQKKQCRDLDGESYACGHLSSHFLPKSRNKRQKVESGWAYTGSDYKSNKCSGDIKRKNKLEPYAYWPLDRKLLNSREENREIARQGMTSVVKKIKKHEIKCASAALSIKGRKAQKKLRGRTKKLK